VGVEEKYLDMSDSRFQAGKTVEIREELK